MIDITIEFISTNNIKNILKVSLNLDIQGDKYGNIKYKSNKKILWNSK